MNLAIPASFIVMMWAALARASPRSNGCPANESSVLLQTQNSLPKPNEDTDAKWLGRWRRWRRHSRRHRRHQYYVVETSTTTTTTTSTTTSTSTSTSTTTSTTTSTSTSTSTNCCVVEVWPPFLLFERDSSGTLPNPGTEQIFTYNIGNIPNFPPDFALPDCCCGEARVLFFLSFDPFTGSTVPDVPSPELISPNGDTAFLELNEFDDANDELEFQLPVGTYVPIEASGGPWTVNFSYPGILQGVPYSSVFRLTVPDPSNTFQTCQ